MTRRTPEPNPFVFIAILIFFFVITRQCAAQIWPASSVVIFKDSVKLQRYTSKNTFITGNEKLILLEVDPHTEYKLTRTVYDTVFSNLAETIEPNNPKTTHVNMTTYLNSGKPDISDKSFAGVNDLTKISSSTVTFTITREKGMIAFYGERWEGVINPPKHGLISIYVDDKLAGTANQGLAPYNTDLKRGAPTFKMVLKKGTHTISIRAAAQQQHIIDFFGVYDYSVTPRQVVSQ